MIKKARRILSFLLVAMLLASTFSLTALAEGLKSEDEALSEGEIRIVVEDPDETVADGREENAIHAHEETSDNGVIVITEQPQDADITAGSAEFSVSAAAREDADPLCYQWQRLDASEGGSGVWEDLPGENAPILTTEDFYEYNFELLSFRCVISAGEEQVISEVCGLIYDEDGEDGFIGENEYGEMESAYDGEIADLFSEASSEVDLFLQFGQTQLKQPTVTRSGSKCKCAKFVSESARYAGIPTSVIPNASVASPYVGSSQFGFIDSSGNARFGCQAFTYKDFKDGTYKPQKGDLIFYGYMKSSKSGTADLTVQQVAANGTYWHTHVGIVRNNDSTKNKIYTIEGNTSGYDLDGVKRSSGYTFNKTRTISNTSTGYMWSQGKNNSTKIFIMEFVRPAFRTATNITFSFQANGGSGSMADISAAYGSDYGFPACAFSYTGYTFAGWNVYCPAVNKWYVDGRGWMSESEISAAGLEKRLYTPASSVSLNSSWIEGTGGSTAFTLYAIWNQDGGSGSVGNISWSYDAATATLTVNGTGQMPDFNGFNNFSPWADYKDSVKTILIGNGLTSIGTMAFMDFSALTSVSLPSSIRSIGASAFYDTANLTAIQFPEGLEYIGADAFALSGLTSLYLPASLTKLDTLVASPGSEISGEILMSPFRECHLTQITVQEGNPAYCSENNALLTKDKTHLIIGPTVSDEYTVPDGVEVIEGYAFYFCEEMTGIILPSSLRWIGYKAFYGCFELKNVYYRGSFGAKLIGFPANLEHIGVDAFNTCLELTTIWFSGYALKSICSYAFYNCCSVGSVEIPRFVESIGNCAFRGIGNYGEACLVYFYGDPPEINSGAFSSAAIEGGGALLVFYPANRTLWTSDKFQGYGGNLEWSSHSGIKSYTIRYDANGGAGAPSEAYVGTRISTMGYALPSDSISIVLSSEIPVHPGYEFLGWALTSDAQTAEFQAGQSATIVPAATATEIVFYAVWNKITTPAEEYWNNIFDITVGDIPEDEIDEEFGFEAGKTAIQLAYELYFSEAFLAKSYCSTHYAEALYKGLLNRSPSYQELSAMRNLIDGGGFWEEAFNAVVGSDEFAALCQGKGLERGDLIPVPPAGTRPAGCCSVENCIYNYDHTCQIVSVGEQAPTCTAEGRKAHYECSLCGACYSDVNGETRISGWSVIIQPTGHIPGPPVREKEVKPSAVQEGSYDEVVYCTVCHAELSRSSHTLPVVIYTLSQTNLTLAAGTSAILTVDNDQNSTAVPVWSSNDSSVASVDSSGKITARLYGTALITAAIDGAELTCVVRVLFSDVPESGVYYADAVYWAADKGITVGYASGEYAGMFGVGQNCERRQLMLFLWRYAGSPTKDKNGMAYPDAKTLFNDVGAYGASSGTNKAIAWAYTEGIAKGYKDGGFHPTAPIVRKDVMIMLYRLAGKPKVSGTLSFPDCKDMKPGSDTYNAILWGVQKGITKGYSSGEYAGQFGTNLDCLREQIVTFLYRYNSKIPN